MENTAGKSPTEITPEIQANLKARFQNLIQRVFLALTFVVVGMFFVAPANFRKGGLITGLIAIAVGIAIKTVEILYPNKWAKFSGRVSSCYDSLERHQQFYSNVVVLAFFVGFAYIVDKQNFFVPVGLLVIFYCLYVATYDVLRTYQALAETTLGKGLIALGFAIGSNIAFSISGWFIGELTHIAPSTFPHTLSFLAIGAIPILFLIVGLLYLPIAFLAVPFVFMASTLEDTAPRLMKWLFARKFEKPVRRYVIATLIFQMVFYSFLAGLVPRYFFNFLNQYSKDIEAVVARSIYAFDMYPGRECKGASDYRVASLGDENFILAKIDSAKQVTFEKPRNCPLQEPGH